MGGREASSEMGRVALSVLRGRSIELENERHTSSCNMWKFNILEARADGTKVVLSYATPTAYEHPNRNTTVAKYKLKSGIYTGQNGNRTAKTHNLDLSKATELTGQTYSAGPLLKEAGLKWDSAGKKRVRR
ncbi:hypothetical protein [Olsenella uli]|uniref:hypothetical protein n=1 Tax=Olsenella uli TaxID=133926 RepID=UPI0012AC379A|nr:hypothetical protein [Olsenella uli]